MKRSSRNSWDFYMIFQKTFIKHVFVENIVFFSVIYFVLEYNIMKHMSTDYQAQWQFNVI